MDIWNLSRIEQKLIQQSIATGREAANLAGWIWEEILGFDKNGSGQVGDEQIKHIFEKLKSGEPVQYIAGHAWFYGLKFVVGPAVLIPRPETEELVEWVFTDVKKIKKKFRILDLGTGSGCIAISLKHLLGDVAEIMAIDVSQEALKLAVQNAKRLKANIIFRQHDFLKNNFDGLGEFDFIVSNPPYVSHSVHVELKERLKFEPAQALFPEGEDENIFYARIAEKAPSTLTSEGACYLELNEFNTASITQFFLPPAWKSIEVRNDLQGLPRMLKVVKSKPNQAD